MAGPAVPHVTGSWHVQQAPELHLAARLLHPAPAGPCAHVPDPSRDTGFRGRPHPAPGVSEGLVMSHLLLPIQRDPGTCSLQGVTASCLSFPICTLGLCSPRRAETGAQLAEDASRVSNLTPRFSALPLPSPSFCRVLPPRGVSSPKVTRQMGLGADTPAPCAQPPPLATALHVLATPWGLPALPSPSGVPLPPHSPQKANIQGDGLRAAALPVALAAEPSRLQHGRYVSPSRAPGM